MKCVHATIWQGNKTKEGEIFFLTQDPLPFLALMKLAGSTRVSPAIFWTTDISAVLEHKNDKQEA